MSVRINKQMDKHYSSQVHYYVAQLLVQGQMIKTATTTHLVFGSESDATQFQAKEATYLLTQTPACHDCQG